MESECIVHLGSSRGTLPVTGGYKWAVLPLKAIYPDSALPGIAILPSFCCWIKACGTSGTAVGAYPAVFNGQWHLENTWI